MIEKKIRSMTKAELVDVLEKTKEKIDEINQKHPEIIEIRESLDKGGLLDQIRRANSDATVKTNEISEYHRRIFKGGEESSAIESAIEELINKFRTEQNEIEEKKREMYGYTGEDERGNQVKYEGYVDSIKNSIDSIRNTIKGYEEKYNALYKRIETELDSGATTVSLSKNFNDKAEEYKKSRRMWEVSLSGSFVIFIIAGSIYFLVFPWFLSLTNEYFMLHTFRILPLVGIFIWLMIFLGNRRAENKKLEEAYKHKAAMARSFAGYKKSIVDLSKDDQTLLTKLMEDLLVAIKKDSSDFLSAKGEKHPVYEAAKGLKPSKPDA